MNFSGVYTEEDFARNPNFIHINCTDIDESRCYCSKIAEKNIKKRIESYPPEGVHFIDSGDYHYLTKIWTDKITRPFSLILFDHHTDMQPSEVPGILTCGDWVKAMLDTNRFLRHVYIIGIPESAERNVELKYMDRVTFCDSDELHRNLAHDIPLEVDGPVYVSIDKDLLDEKDAETNWDQGDVKLSEIVHALRLLMNNDRIIGVDVCGEYSAMESLYEEEMAAREDSHANEVIWETMEKAV